MEEDKCAVFFKNKVSRSALLEGTIDDFIDEQENQTTRAKTDGKVSLLKSFLQRKINSGALKKHLLLNTKKLLTELVFTVRSKDEWNGQERHSTSMAKTSRLVPPVVDQGRKKAPVAEECLFAQN